jgi:hypothetical protein
MGKGMGSYPGAILWISFHISNKVNGKLEGKMAKGQTVYL